MRILVFDDDTAIGRLVVRIATMSGVEAMAVTDAKAFGQRLLTDPPQIVMLDLQLGDTDGVEQMRLLAERQFTGVLVLMSGFDPRVLATARAVGKSLGLKVLTTTPCPVIQGQLQKRCSLPHLQQRSELLLPQLVERLHVSDGNAA